VRIPIDAIGGVGNANLLEHRDDRRTSLPSGSPAVRAKGVAQLRPDLQRRVEAGQRILEDHRDLASPKAA
jgi:hypothetical protein